MTLILAFLAVVATVAAWWLSHQGLTAKPWLQEGAGTGFTEPSRIGLPPAKLGLLVFLTVAGALFTMLISGYFMRRSLGDWRPLPIPTLLWIDTGILVASSLALELARRASGRDERDAARVALVAGGALAVLFVAGQVAAWRQMAASGFSIAGNPSNTFFYLLTGLHALHVLGGLVALGATIEKAWSAADWKPAAAQIDLCALYWHFLLVVWLVLLALLTGFADGLGAICGRLLS